MRCPYCNAQNDENSVFCGECGKRLKEDAKEQYQDDSLWTENMTFSWKPEEGTQNHQTVNDPNEKVYQKNAYHEEGYQRGYAPPSSGNGNHNAVLYVMIGVCLTVVVVLSIVVGMNIRSSKMEDSVSNISNTQASANVAEDRTEDTRAENTVEEDAASALPYTDNTYADVNACLSLDAFAYEQSKDGAFGFYYPKYLFNQSTVDETGTKYHLSYEENGDVLYDLYFYEEETSGDLLQNVSALQSNYLNMLASQPEPYQPIKKRTENFAWMIAAGLKSGETNLCLYAVASNDGNKNYVMEFHHYDPDVYSDYDSIDYVVDCLYRGFTRSGSTYKPRSYDFWKNGIDGEKK